MHISPEKAAATIAGWCENVRLRNRRLVENAGPEACKAFAGRAVGTFGFSLDHSTISGSVTNASCSPHCDSMPSSAMRVRCAKFDPSSSVQTS